MWQAVSADRVAPVVVPVEKHVDTERMQNCSKSSVVKKKYSKNKWKRPAGTENDALVNAWIYIFSFFFLLYPNSDDTFQIYESQMWLFNGQ